MTMVPLQRNGGAIGVRSRRGEKQAAPRGSGRPDPGKLSGIQTPLYNFIF